MRHFTLYLIILTFIISGVCCDSQNDTLYQIINDLAKDSTIKADIVFTEINTIHNSAELLKDTLLNGYPAPPIYGAIYYNRDYFIDLYKSGLIPSSDIDYMHNQSIDLSDILLDSSKVECKVISIRYYKSLSKKYSDNNSKANSDLDTINDFSSKKFIYFSNPIYSRQNQALISIWLFNIDGLIICKTLFLKMENKKWSIYKILDERNRM